MFFGDVMIPAFHAKSLRRHQHVRGTESFWRLELVAGEFDLESVRVAQIDRVHESAIALIPLDAAFRESRRRHLKRRARHVERDVFDAADFTRCVAPCIGRRFVREHRDQATVARIEVQVILVGLAEIRLFHDERHAEHPLPEVDRALARRTDEGDVMDALNLDAFGHVRAPN